MFVLQNIEAKELEIEGLRFTEYSSGQVPVKFDLLFTASETAKDGLGNEIAFSIRYCTALFKKETIEQMAEHLQDLIDVIAADRTVQI
jgi:non-ribosomal peptide synthetase component F